MSRNTIILLIIFIFVILFFLIFKHIYFQNAVLPPLPSFRTHTTPPSESLLFLSPDHLSAVVGKPATVDVMIDTQGETPTIIQLELAYDPSALTNISMQPGNFYAAPHVLLENVNKKNGRISYAIESLTSEIPLENDGIVATISFTPTVSLYTHETSLYFLPKTMIRKHEKINTLKAAYGAKIISATSSANVTNN